MIDIKVKDIGCYIVKNEINNIIRYFVIGAINDGKFTGMMHDYLGAGLYSEALVVADAFVPNVANCEDDSKYVFEWSEQESIFEDYTTLTMEELNTVACLYMEYSSEEMNYVANEKFLELIEKGEAKEGRVVIDNFTNRVPYGLGNTTFIDGYELENPVEVGLSKEEDSLELGEFTMAVEV